MQGERGERRGEEQEELDARAERDFCEGAATRWMRLPSIAHLLRLLSLCCSPSLSLSSSLSVSHPLTDSLVSLCPRTATPRLASPRLDPRSASSTAGSPRTNCLTPSLNDSRLAAQ